tara:strand:+ start:1138 stop:1353 length:216 start_codon:yes stop_codon:yes gene_type:complete
MLNPDNIEDLKSIEKCREITQEILRFGVNDLEIKKIIDILSLELEDTTMMRNIQNILKNNEVVKDKPKFEL